MSVRTKHERKVDSTHEADLIAVIPDAKPPCNHADFLPVLEKPERKADFPSGADNEASLRRFRSKRARVLSSRSGSPLLARNSSANPMSSVLHGFAYNLVNLFRLQLPQAWRSTQIETQRARLFKLGARVRQTARCIRIHLATGWPWQSLFRGRGAGSEHQLTPFSLYPNSLTGQQSWRSIV